MALAFHRSAIERDLSFYLTSNILSVANGKVWILVGMWLDFPIYLWYVHVGCSR